MPDSPEKIEPKSDSKPNNVALPDDAEAQGGFSNLLDIVESTNLGSEIESNSTSPVDTGVGVTAQEDPSLPGLEIDNSGIEAVGGALAKPEESATLAERGSELSGQAREEYYSKRFSDVTGQDSVIKEGPEKELNNWADSWKDFVENAEVPEGDFRDLLQNFGAQMILGEFDESGLARQMSKIESSHELQTTIDDLNKGYFKNYGVKIDLDFNDKGKLNTIELKALESDGKIEALLRVSSSGKVYAEAKGDEGNPLSQKDAVKKVARKASPLACP